MKSILFAILSGLLLVLCFPRFDLGFLAWFAMVPFFIALKGNGLKSTLGLSLIVGIIFYLCVFFWFKQVKAVTWIDFILLVAYLSFCYFGLFGLGLNLVSRKTRLPLIVIAPVLWVSLEYARSYAGFVSHPQMLMGHSQYLNLPAIQISAFTGTYGVSFLIVMVNVAISEVINNRLKAFKPVIATVIISGVSFIYGFNVIAKEPVGDNIRITVVQPNIPTEIKWKREFRKQNLNKMVQMTREIKRKENSSLIVWPEAAVQGSFMNELYLLNTISSLTKEIGTHLLFGSAQHPKHGSREFRKEKKFNSAFLVSPEGKIEGQYNKIHLLPFGEYLPYKDAFFWPSRFAAMAGNIVPGTEYTTFNLNGAMFGTTICWENLYPELFRRFVKNGANFMINITNEDQLEDTAAPYQLAAISVFRSVENRVSTVRCGNTGISCFIEPNGKIVGSVHGYDNKETFVDGYLTEDIPISYKKTFYSMYGDVFIYMNFIMTAFMLALCFFKGKKYSATKFQNRTGPAL